ncbi:MAG: hypothetical protein ACJ77K_17580 [Bacteroidia bacterium]
MKNKTIQSFLAGIVITLFLSFNYSSDTGKIENDPSLARVSKVSGKWVFMRCEPIQDYDVVFDVAPWGSGKTPEDIANLIVTDALKVGKKKKLDFDAVVIGSTKRDIAIKFK